MATVSFTITVLSVSNHGDHYKVVLDLQQYGQLSCLAKTIEEIQDQVKNYVVKKETVIQKPVLFVGQTKNVSFDVTIP